MSRILRASCAAVALMAGCPSAFSQSNTQLPQIEVNAQGGTLTVPTVGSGARTDPAHAGRRRGCPRHRVERRAPPRRSRTCSTSCPGSGCSRNGATISRLSIRGSGLSRNFHLRGVQLFMDGIPINTADGYGDFQEIDPSAYRYVEVFKGANALRFGANSLGGAINFVTPSGRDARTFDGRIDGGSFGFARGQASTGGVRGPFDWFVTGSAPARRRLPRSQLRQFRARQRQLRLPDSPDAETRFYVNGNRVRQRIPGR